MNPLLRLEKELQSLSSLAGVLAEDLRASKPHVHPAVLADLVARVGEARSLLGETAEAAGQGVDVVELQEA
jgi:hypothetical protein